MISFEATKTQKIALAIISVILTLLLIFNFFLYTPYKEYKKAALNDSLLNDRIEAYYREIMRLHEVKKEFTGLDRQLGEAKSKLFVDGAQVLNVLTKNSPVSNFTFSVLQKDKKKEIHTGIVEYPFEIGFKSSYQKLGEYLRYQETALPISFITSIEIKPVKREPDKLETRLSGIIYTVTNL